eukprot:GHRR01036732.1.p1 GENE.GHRR01036732.1~~GHRR01036732.1.p1  ORF type:complete len:249 (+),score=56.41 GHRR01036732.1:283-1029(+)
MGTAHCTTTCNAALHVYTSALCSDVAVCQHWKWPAQNIQCSSCRAPPPFAVCCCAVASKLLMLLTPFLGKWTYTRMHEQIAGGQRYRPPSVDVNAPDLFIPLMGLWSYALLSCIVLASKHTFTPESMSKTLWSASSAWFVHWFVVWLLLKVVNVPGVAWSELTAYTGYPFVAVCLTTLGGFLAGKWGYYALWAYGSLCMAMFMVKTIKRVMFQETRAYGTDLRLANYLLLGLALFQFPFIFWLAYRPK